MLLFAHEFSLNHDNNELITINLLTMIHIYNLFTSRWKHDFTQKLANEWKYSFVIWVNSCNRTGFISKSVIQIVVWLCKVTSRLRRMYRNVLWVESTSAAFLLQITSPYIPVASTLLVFTINVDCNRHFSESIDNYRHAFEQMPISIDKKHHWSVKNSVFLVNFLFWSNDLQVYNQLEQNPIQRMQINWFNLSE